MERILVPTNAFVRSQQINYYLHVVVRSGSNINILRESKGKRIFGRDDCKQEQVIGGVILFPGPQGRIDYYLCYHLCYQLIECPRRKKK